MGSCPPFWGTAAAELSRELIPDPAGNQKLRRHLALLGLEMETAVYRDEYGRLRAELKGEGCQTLDTPEELAALSDLLGVPTRAEAGEESLTLIQLEPLMAVAGVAARKKDGETVSGDAGTYFKREDGTLYVLLCDGMGSGPGAGRESSLAVRLLEQFLMAGVETGHALATLNSALALRGEEEGGSPQWTCSRWTCSQGRGRCTSWELPPPMCGEGARCGGSQAAPCPLGWPLRSTRCPTIPGCGWRRGTASLWSATASPELGTTPGSGSGWLNSMGTSPKELAGV